MVTGAGAVQVIVVIFNKICIVLAKYVSILELSFKHSTFVPTDIYGNYAFDKG